MVKKCAKYYVTEIIHVREIIRVRKSYEFSPNNLSFNTNKNR